MLLFHYFSSKHDFGIPFFFTSFRFEISEVETGLVRINLTEMLTSDFLNLLVLTLLG